MKASSFTTTLSGILAVVGLVYWSATHEFGPLLYTAIFLMLFSIMQAIREHTAEMRDQMERDREARWNIAAGNPKPGTTK